jgi:hypothetical protein
MTDDNRFAERRGRALQFELGTESERKRIVDWLHRQADLTIVKGGVNSTSFAIAINALAKHVKHGEHWK